MFAIPGDINAATGGYAYDRQVMAECARMGFHLEHLALPGGFPNPNANEMNYTRHHLSAVPTDCPLLVDGLALGAFDEITLQAIAAPLVALVHHPLACESGIQTARKAELLSSERQALSYARKVIAVSNATANLLKQDYAVAADKIIVVNPGVALADRARGSQGGPLSLLAVGALSQRKAYPLLIEALSGISSRDWHLTLIGKVLDRSEDEKIRSLIARNNLHANVKVSGEVSEAVLIAAYRDADVFVMPSLFEGYGMVVTEALARGLPIVSSTGGALAGTVPEEAALKVPPGDMLAFRRALDRMLGEAGLRQKLARAAWALSGQLPRWQTSAATMISVLKETVR